MHIEVVPSIKPITAIDPLSVVNGGDVVPPLPAELITSPLNAVAMSGDCSRADENFVGVIGIFKHLVIPKIIIPIRTGSVARVTRASTWQAHNPRPPSCWVYFGYPAPPRLALG